MTPEQIAAMRQAVRTADKLTQRILECEVWLDRLLNYRDEFRVSGCFPGSAHLEGGRSPELSPEGLKAAIAVLEQDARDQIAAAKAELESLKIGGD